MKLAHRLVQIPGQLGDGLRAHRLPSNGGHYPSHLSGRDPAQKCLPDQQRDLFGTPLETSQAHRQKALLAGARNAEPNRPEAGHEIPLIVAVAVSSSFPPPTLVPRPAREAVALPLRLQLKKLLPGFTRLPIQIAPETLFHLG